MAKSRKLEELTASLNQIRPDPTSEAAAAVLQQVLGSKYSIASRYGARAAASRSPSLKRLAL
ncbi:hypothetical protein [Leptolyngbya ohadii]|uniref:hypothetical protein n=1 Tax=Leptolyngbya ohadii TaxID=1962290 RepID=UPI000B59D73D|nr:hypothetical protein [Leptolyngbya ohadii]